jgi:hypothetical protein
MKLSEIFGPLSAWSGIAKTVVLVVCFVFVMDFIKTYNYTTPWDMIIVSLGCSAILAATFVMWF